MMASAHGVYFGFFIAVPWFIRLMAVMARDGPHDGDCWNFMVFWVWWRDGFVQEAFMLPDSDLASWHFFSDLAILIS
jgi:hypothetical protein